MKILSQLYIYSHFVNKIKVCRDELKLILLFGTCAQGEQAKKWQIAAPWELWDTLNNKLPFAELMDSMRFAWFCYYYASFYAIVMDLFVLSHQPSLDWLPCTWYVLLHFTSRRSSLIVALHVLWYSMYHAIPCLVLFHILWKSSFPQKIFKFYMQISVCTHTWTVRHEWRYSWAAL